METIEQRAVTQGDLDLFCQDQQRRYDSYIGLCYPNNIALFEAKHYATIGPRYARIVREEGRNGGCSVVCFIDLTNGDILKGSWKAPVKNGRRGNIFTPDRGASAMSEHGVRYLR